MIQDFIERNYQMLPKDKINLNSSQKSLTATLEQSL